MYLNVYVPQLQREQGVASFFRVHRGPKFASSVLMDPTRTKPEGVVFIGKAQEKVRCSAANGGGTRAAVRTIRGWYVRRPGL